MSKLLKISGRSLGVIIEWVFILLISFAFLIRTSYVQTYIAKKAANYLSSELQAEITIDEVAITFFNEAAFDNLLVRDRQGDTLLFAKTAYASVGILDIAKQNFSLKTARVENAFVHIQRDKEGEFNHQFIKDYFARPPSDKEPPKFRIKSIELENSRFMYDDHRREPRSAGMDFWHLNVKNITGDVSNFKVVKDVITADLNALELKEKSGLVLKNLVTGVEVSPKGVLLSDVEITTQRSLVKASAFNMYSNDYEDFRDFVDSVSLEGTLKKSQVALNEIALFGPALTGMNDVVQLSGSVKNKVTNLKISDLELNYRERTTVRGDLILPDYRNPEKGFYHEIIHYAYIDINELSQLRLPNSATTNYLELNPRIHRLRHIEIKDANLDGFTEQFVVAAHRINTQLGSARLNNGIMFTRSEDDEYYYFEKSEASNYDVKVEKFNLGEFEQNETLGLVDGIFFLSGRTSSIDDIRFTLIEGEVNRFDFMEYPYSNISIKEGDFIDEVFAAKIDINDENLELSFDGFIDTKGKQHMDFTVDIKQADLQKINITSQNLKVSSRVNVDMTGNNLNRFEGQMVVNDFLLFSQPEDQKAKELNVDHLTFDITRGATADRYYVNSSLGTGEVIGKVNFNYLADDFRYQLSNIFPTLYTETLAKRSRRKMDHFTYDIQFGQTEEVLNVFAPGVYIAPGTELKGSYFGESSNLVININSKKVSYLDKSAIDISLHQVLDSNSVMGTYHISTFHANDSISFQDVYLETSGLNNSIESELVWEQGTPTASSIKWTTQIRDFNHYNFNLDPSYFHIRERRWEIVNASRFSIEGDTVSVTDFKLQRAQQFISINGQMSDQDKHRLNFEINDIELSEFSWLVTSQHMLEGKINGWGFLSNPIHNFYYLGDANIAKLKIDGIAVGDVFVQSSWNNENESIYMTGDLIYKDVETFSFEGDYYRKKEENSLDVELIFDYMDIQFANAFMNPEVLSNIGGLIDGRLQVKGDLQKPEVSGVVELKGGTAKVDFLGTHFIAEGPIEVVEDAFYINNIPVYDEDGNAGSLVGSIYHTNYSDFNFNLFFDLENDAVNKDPLRPGRPLKLERFLVMDTPYDPDFAYYGKGYCTGDVNVFGYTDNLEITVNVTSQEGTWINIPMYGVGEIEEETSFIVFKEDLKDEDSIVPKFDLTGVDLDLNINVTPAAEIKIIFNEDVGDMISSHGSGNIRMNVNNFGQISMEGTYTVTSGVYNFAMGIVKKKFFIEEGGTITWTGDPYDADLDLRTYYRTYANIADISADQFGSGSGSHQLILCYLDLSGSLLNPAIAFDIQAPQANDLAQSLIARIKSDPDELNRQFFSLLLQRKFQPLQGTSSAYSNTGIDVIENQINALLNMVSEEYKMNVNVDKDQLSGEDIYEFGVSKGFLDNRLILSGSFGVENKKIDDENSTQSLIGDVNIEYVLNEDGTFRVNVFNESTDKTVIFDAADQGLFTQGAGLIYQEEFNDFEDFKMIQSFLNLFRKSDNKKYTPRQRRKLVPVDGRKEDEVDVEDDGLEKD